MKTCASFRLMIPLSAGDDLDPRDRAPLQNHLRDCPICRREESEYKSVIAAARVNYGRRHELSTTVRNRIAIEAAERTRRSGWIHRIPLPAPFSAGRLAAAVAALVAVVLLPVALRDGGPGHSVETRPVTIEVRAVEPGVVTLAWSNGERGAYTVYKSHDPRRFAHAEVHRVDGTIWTDVDPESSGIVYYRIE